MTPASGPQEPDPPAVSLRGPADLVAVTPYLLGFHPADSLVVVAFRDGRVTFAARGDLPDPTSASHTRVADELLQVVGRQLPDTVALLGYGAASDVDGPVRAVHKAAEQRGLVVREALRVEAGRWWSYLCTDRDCCPPTGTEIDLTASEVSARCAFAGLPALPDRQQLAGQVAPLSGPARAAMTDATERAERRLADWLSGVPEQQWQESVDVAGAAAVREAVARYAAGAALGDDELAWLSLLLVSTTVRDTAWQAGASEPRLRLWRDVTIRADPALAAAPATLLGFTAWRCGDGVLARLALERALHEDPSYSLARLLTEALDRGVPPSVLDGWEPPAPAQVTRPEWE